MATDQKRLDELFPWAPDAEVLKSLRDLMRAIEARLSPLDAQSQNYSATVEELRQIAIARLNEVLLPAYNELAALLDTGIPSDHIIDSGVFGRSLIGLPARSDLLSLMALKITEVELQGGVFYAPELRNAVTNTANAESIAGELVNAAWVRRFISALNVADQSTVANFYAGLRALAPAAGDDSDRVVNSAWVKAAIAVLSGAINTALNTKAPLESPALTGSPTAPSAPIGSNDGRIANTNFVAITAALKANLASPALTGVPTAPTPAAGTNTTQIATAAFVQAALAALVNSSPAALDTLQELAAALGNDPNFATTTATALGNRLRFDAAQSLNGTQISQALTNAGVSLADLRRFITAGSLSAALTELGLGTGSSPTFNTLSATTQISSGKYILAGIGSNWFAAGNGDGAAYGTTNVRLRLHYGLGMETHDGTVNGYWNSRDGFWDTKGVPKVNGQNVWYPGNFDPSTKATRGADVIFRDVTCDRGNGTGVVYFGGARYLHFDGVNYNMPSSDLYVNGGVVLTTANSQGSLSDGYGIQRFPSGLCMIMNTSVLKLDGNGMARINVGLTAVSGSWMCCVSNGDYGVNSGRVVSGANDSTGFNIQFLNSADATVRVNWIAWGRWK